MRGAAFVVLGSLASFTCGCSSSSDSTPSKDEGAACTTYCDLPEDDLAVLDAPAAGKGVQFQMPEYGLQSGTEWEGCFASWFDYTDVVPDEFKSEDGKSFYVDSTVVHQTQGSHHLVVMNTPLTEAHLTDATFGEWTCKGGERDGEGCEPMDAEACPGAVCGSAPEKIVACLGYGPAEARVNPSAFGLANIMQSRVAVPTIPGVYRKIPLRGIIYWDLHAFNLTEGDRVQHANLNVTFAKDRRFFERRLTISGDLSGVPPYTRKDLCAEWVVPEGTEILRLTSHTHQRGEDFRAWDPAGDLLYQNLVYSDPGFSTFQPPLVFGSGEESNRTIKFCNIFNNGVTEQGAPDPSKVVRLSKAAGYERSKPVPIACAAGKVGEACDHELGHEQCDSSPGAGDGACDAAAVQFGETTAAEMFFLIADVIDPEGETRDDSSLAGTLSTARPLPPADAPY